MSTGRVTSIRTLATLASLFVHASIGYAMLPAFISQQQEALEFGKGNDVVNVEQGIAIEGLAKLGDAVQTIETADITPVEQTPPPVEEVKTIDELSQTITSTTGEVDENVVKTEEKPLEPTPPKEVVEAVVPPQQVVAVSEQSSGEAKQGGDARAYGLYLGKINDHVQRAKVNPRARVAGTVVMRFIIGTDGALVSKEIASSSGSKLLDDAALAAIDRAAPFPPIPPEVSSTPLAFTQPFKFVLR